MSNSTNTAPEGGGELRKALICSLDLAAVLAEAADEDFYARNLRSASRELSDRDVPKHHVPREPLEAFGPASM